MVNKTTKKSGISVGESKLHNSKKPVAPVVGSAVVAPVVAPVVASAVIAKTPAVVGKTPAVVAPVVASVVTKESAVVAPVVAPIVAPVVAKTSVVSAVVAPVEAKTSVVAKAPVVVPVVAKTSVVGKAPVVAAVVAPVVAPVVAKTSAVVPVVAKAAVVVAKAPPVVAPIAKASVVAPVVAPIVAKTPAASPVVAKASAVAPVVAHVVAKTPAVVGGHPYVKLVPLPETPHPTTHTPLSTIPEEESTDKIHVGNSVGVTAPPETTEPSPSPAATTELKLLGEPAAGATETAAGATETAVGATETAATTPAAPAKAAAPTPTAAAPAADGEAPAAQPGKPPPSSPSPALNPSPELLSPSPSLNPADGEAPAAQPGQPPPSSPSPELKPSPELLSPSPATQPGQPPPSSPSPSLNPSGEPPLNPSGEIVLSDEQKGGSPTDNSLYMLFSSILLLTSCLSFCIATVLFINACINLHKAQNGFMKDENTEPIIEQPIIEYLKPNNFLYIDKFLLDMKESKSPVVITLGIIIAISITVLGALIAYWSQQNKDTFKEWQKSLTNKTSFLKYIPIIYIIIIGLVFNNSIITANKDTLNTFEKEFDKLIINFNFKEPTLKETFLKELKKIIISEIYNNYKNDKFEYNEKTITEKLLTNVNINITTKITAEGLLTIFGNSTDTNYTIPKVIFYIYKLSYYKKKKEDENIIDYDKRIKDDIQEYINRIDRYFNILINDKGKDTNYYNKFYLISLIKKDSSVDIDSSNYVKEINPLKNLNFNDKIESIKNRIQTYYIAIIVLYIILLIFLLIYYFENFHNLWIFICNLLFIYNINILRASISIVIIVIILSVLFSMRNYKI